MTGGDDFEADVAAVAGIDLVPDLLEIVCSTTGMGFALVARVSPDRWMACHVLDHVAIGLRVGDELPVAATFCDQIRRQGMPIVFERASTDPMFAAHPAVQRFGIESYVSYPIHLRDGRFFGTLCAFDPAPRRVDTPQVRRLFRTFARIIGHHLSSVDRLHAVTTSLAEERRVGQMRDRFIAVLGHDLRTPMAAISACASILKKRSADDLVLSMAAKIRDSTGRMAVLIDDILDFARNHLGDGIELRWERVADLSESVRRVVQELQAQLPDQWIDSRVDIRSPIDCDPARIEQLIGNLLGNAVSYGRADTPVRLTVTVCDERLTIEVWNDGEPIPPDRLPRLFDAFNRASGADRHDGLGLGLFICDAIVNAHGGKINVTSTLEAGTTFTVTIPGSGPCATEAGGA